MTHNLRILLVTTLAASLMLTLVPRVEAHHKPNFHCSKSGDLCQSTRKVNGKRRLTILLAAPYFKWFHLCLRDPEGYETCEPFKIRKRDEGVYGRSVRAGKHLGYNGKGKYVVSWWDGDDRIGRKLGFHAR